MDHIKAIGFDLFNTLIIAEAGALDEAMRRLMTGLAQNGVCPEIEPFQQAYREAALGFIRQAAKDGVETHNRFWISAALEGTGYSLSPDDPRISTAVEAYFSAFFDYCHPVPGTHAMLETLRGSYRLGLLSNFTHAPAALKLIDLLGLDDFFEVVLISGEMGFRKPHPRVFDKLAGSLGVDGGEMLYVGDDTDADIGGALSAGIQPVWFTYARDRKSPLPLGATSDPSEIPAPDIPSISSWGELPALLHR
ncbi:MAG: HAD-IA family hydrolase [Deltaproteobacteria bacterium]|nr:HAD-IA family hydrolase [Deltaproteobacteria bacterium]